MDDAIKERCAVRGVRKVWRWGTGILLFAGVVMGMLLVEARATSTDLSAAFISVKGLNCVF